jgi:predicted HTH transcriptional regulator
VPESKLIEIEEKITNIIHDQCHPVILPEVSFVNLDGKYIIKVQIFKGNDPPYFIKKKGVEEGTFIRVGSSNRQATPDIIAELKRQHHNISFDGEISYEKTADVLEFLLFEATFLEKTGEAINAEVLKKLELIKQSRGLSYPTNALILLSEDEIKRKLFPYSKIECARFKGIEPGNFNDQKSFEGSILSQPEEAYQFVLRHISQGTTDYTGVYRNDRWEYPVIAIREAIRNAVIHRDYSLSGMDIKVAIFDDKIEITSPGKLPPTIDFTDMLSGQSNIRNKILAPIFKRLGIIEQWGNGLKLIADELKKYPEIGFDWKEPGMSFRVIFFNLHPESKTREKTVEEILSQLKKNPKITLRELQNNTGLSRRGIEWNISKLKQEGRIERIGPDKGGYWKVLD